jgi:hypothetical protein
MNNEMVNEEWLQMNFPIGTGPQIIENACLDPSNRHYMTIQFGKDEESAFFMINETTDNKYGIQGLRSHNDRTVFSFAMSRELLLKIVRVIQANNYIQYNDDMREW